MVVPVYHRPLAGKIQWPKHPEQLPNPSPNARGRDIGLVPFLPAGYPDLETTAAAMNAVDAAGAAAIEIGFPFSDPIADGPTIQHSFTAALARKVKVSDIFAIDPANRLRKYPRRWSE